MIVVDTDVLIEIFDRRSAKGDEALRRIVDSGEDVAITSISLHEILYGLHKYGKPAKDVVRLPVLGYTKEEAVLSARLEAEMETKGTPTRRTDAMIAAVAMNKAARLYTFDLKHFDPLEALGVKLLK